MLLPTRVVPSNAPPLQEDNGVQQASRVLQEHSGNRQHIDLNGIHNYEPKYASTALNEVNCPRHHVAPPTQHYYRTQTQRHSPYRYGSHGSRPYISAQQEAKYQYEAERLYRRFRQSDQYVKYRERQSKDDKGNGDQKWPDHLEKAFFRALVQHAPMGRRKLLHKDKQRGRNELIADCIEEITGEARSRKQVSSHIQVLKPFVEHDPLIMKWLSKEDMGITPHRGLPSSSAYVTGRSTSEYPVTALPLSARSVIPTLSHLDRQSIQSVKHDLDVFEPTDFQMFVQRKYQSASGEEHVEHLHAYTQSVDRPLRPDVTMDSWQTLSRNFPLLATMNAHRPIDCNVLVAEASLAVSLQNWKDADGRPLPGVELGISFLCTSRHLPATPKELSSQVICHNSFYEKGALAKDYNHTSEVRLEPSSSGVGVETQIKFGSTFWAKTLGRLAAIRRDATEGRPDDVSSALSSINALQEVFVRSEHGPERILVIHWSFRQSTNPCGRASWSRLVLPTVQDGQFDAPTKAERSDSMFDAYGQFADPSVSQSMSSQIMPTLQSPFEYDSGSASALSSATWPTSISEVSIIESQHDTTNITGENAFDFNAGNINIAYDPTYNFDNFDSSAFSFDTTTADFAADPGLQDYSQDWCDSQTTSFDTQHMMDNGAPFGAVLGLDGHEPVYENRFGSQYEQSSYNTTHDQQAYGGAGQEMMKEEDPLAALADASYIASQVL